MINTIPNITTVSNTEPVLQLESRGWQLGFFSDWVPTPDTPRPMYLVASKPEPHYNFSRQYLRDEPRSIMRFTIQARIRSGSNSSTSLGTTLLEALEDLVAQAKALEPEEWT